MHVQGEITVPDDEDEITLDEPKPEEEPVVEEEPKPKPKRSRAKAKLSEPTYRVCTSCMVDGVRYVEGDTLTSVPPESLDTWLARGTIEEVT